MDDVERQITKAHLRLTEKCTLAGPERVVGGMGGGGAEVDPL